MKYIYTKILISFIVALSIDSCTTNKAMDPPYNPSGQVIIPTVPVTLATACGSNVDSFAVNTFTYIGNCYKISNPKSASGNGFWVMGGYHDLGNGNFVQINVYFKEKIYTSDNFLTISSGSTIGSSNIYIELLDATSSNTTKKYTAYTSEGGQVIPVKSTGAGVQVKFSEITFVGTEGGNRFISASLLIN